MTLRTVAVAFVFVALAVGCSGSDVASVEGSALFDVDGTASGFTFVERTHLADPAASIQDGLIAGYCTVDAEGEGFSVGLSRPLTADSPGVGVHRFDIVNDAEGIEVSALLGEDQYVAAEGDCIEETLGVGPDYTFLRLDCMLSTSDDRQAGLSAELTFENCQVQQ